MLNSVLLEYRRNFLCLFKEPEPRFNYPLHEFSLLYIENFPAGCVAGQETILFDLTFASDSLDHFLSFKVFWGSYEDLAIQPG